MHGINLCERRPSWVGASGVKMEKGAEDTLAQQPDRLALALANGHIRVEDTAQCSKPHHLSPP